jgi:hypothetical protein
VLHAIAGGRRGGGDGGASLFSLKTQRGRLASLSAYIGTCGRFYCYSYLERRHIEVQRDI